LNGAATLGVRWLARSILGGQAMPTILKKTLTAEEFAALDFGDMRSELIEGMIHTMPPTFEDYGEITMRLSVILGRYVRDQRLGKL
jgi:Uma2 family endonuclease